MKKHELLKHAYDNYPKGSIARFDGKLPDHTSTGKFKITDLNKDGNLQVMSDEGHECFYADGQWAEIVKPKIAVKVENEKEFKALMKYYDSLEYVWNGGDEPLKKESLPYYPNAIKFEDKFQHSAGKECPGYQIIPFSEFAADKGIKLPHITTHDGVDLYIGDYLACVWRQQGEWLLTQEYPSIHSNTVSESGQSSLEGERKLFSTKQAALDWIEAQKPKNKVIDLNHQYSLVANCSKDSVSIEYREGIGFPIVFTKEMIYSIVDTLKEFEK